MNQHVSKPALGEIMRSLSFAAAKHRDQRRKDVNASPYINHPISLATILANEAGVVDTNVICAAILHDTIEDTKTTFDELVENFGREIASIVMEVTDNKALSKAERKTHQIQHASSLSNRARLVKLADKISNLRDIASTPPASWNPQRKREYFDWASNVINEIRGTHPRLEALFDEIAENGLSGSTIRNIDN